MKIHYSNCKLFRLKTGAKSHTRITRKTTKKKKYTWFWILIGVLVGVLISSSIFIKFGNYNQSVLSAKQKYKDIKTTTKPKIATAKKNKPIFDFYTILPKMNITDNTKQRPMSQMTDKVHTKTKVAVVSKDKVKYFIQVAAFDKIDEADALKAELTLEGFDAVIKPIQKNNTTWYRIVMGPFSSEQQASQQQRELLKQNIHSSLLKLE